MATASFMGGPADNSWREFPGDEPPPEVTVMMSPAIRFMAGLADELVPIGSVRYIRQVSQLDDGPLWVYVPDDGQP